MTMVTFLPARLGPWAAAGTSARTLDAMTSDPAMAIDVAIGLIFLLGIDLFISAASPVSLVVFYIVLLWAMGAKVARRGATPRRRAVGRPFVYSCSSPYRAGGRRRALF